MTLDTLPTTPDPYPWSDLADTWYAALVADDLTYGLARRTRDATGTRYESWNGISLGWQFDPAGASVFTELGGITDAVPVDAAGALEVLTSLGGTAADLR